MMDVQSLIIGAVIACTSAILGSLVSFFMMRGKINRDSTIQLALSIISGPLAEKRVRFLETLRKSGHSLETLANAKDPAFVEFRLCVFETFNVYDLICEQYANGDIDICIFDRHIRPMITSDYEAIDAFFAEFEAREKDKEDGLLRPYYPNIENTVGIRRKNKGAGSGSASSISTAAGTASQSNT